MKLPCLSIRPRLSPPAACLLAAALLAGCVTGPTPLPYPPTRQVAQVDLYHGQAVADPYRWLEDDHSAETAEWVAAQNRVTEAHLARIPFRAALKARLERLQDYPRTGVPTRRGDWLYYSANSGLQNQNLLYRQKGLQGPRELLFDPNGLSTDGTTRLGRVSYQPAGRYAVLGLSVGGSDWQQLRVLDLASRRLLDERIEWVKISEVAWVGDGFFYSRYPAPPQGRELSSSNESHQVWFHRVGQAADQDALVYEDPARIQRFHTVTTTADGRWAVLSISERGKGRRGNALHVRDLSAGPVGPFQPLLPEIGDAPSSVVGAVGDELLVRTQIGAPNGRVVRISPARPAPEAWTTVLPEQPEPLQDAELAGGRLLATYLKDVTTRAYLMQPDGSQRREIALPGLGTAQGFEGQPGDTEVFYGFTSFTQPATAWRLDLATGASTPFQPPQVPGFDPAAYETRQVFYRSPDGTRVPMFLVHRKGLVPDGSHPTLLYGYGGFNISLGPSFSAQRLALLEQGVVFAVANLRGGGEYGEAWHRAGTKLSKQNVFDDFIAAAQWLIDQRYTSPSRLAIQGGSNGGLLVGAVSNQRPELFRVALPAVGVMDMLRFHRFTIGWNWVADYGSSDDPEEFKALFAYSPLHNIRPGVLYPATLVTTADHDDRVVPAHSFKYTAALQAQASPRRPVLIRIETLSGHGASNTAKQIETAADTYAFLFEQLGVTPRWPPAP